MANTIMNEVYTSDLCVIQLERPRMQQKRNEGIQYALSGFQPIVWEYPTILNREEKPKESAVIFMKFPSYEKVDIFETTQDMDTDCYLNQNMEELKVKVQVGVHIEETEDFDNSEWSDTDSVKSLGTINYSENESGFFGSISDLSGITEIPNCEDHKYKLLQDELDKWRNKELKNDKIEIVNEWYDTGNIYQEISLLKQSFYNKLSRTQKYITHLKRENEKQIIQYETDVQCLHYEYQKLEEDYEMLNQEHNNCVNWDDYFDVVQQEYGGKIDELEKALALEKTKNENLQQRIGCP